MQGVLFFTMVVQTPKIEDEVPRGNAPAKAPAEEEVASLFDQLRDRLLRYIVAVGLPIPEGEEVIQDAFLSLFRHLQADKSRQNLHGWLFRVVHNLALKRLRRSRRRSELLANAAVLDRNTVDSSPSPEDQLVDAETQRRLLAVVDALSEQDRRCLFLRAEGLRYREIAGVLDISLAAVSLSLSRSLARLGRANRLQG